ncbi:hypothetical protein HDU76_007591, partial [Blyttiomyces sp. JEL0837]
DLWTRFLNGRLSIEEIKSHGTELWNDAFDRDWSGDLGLLPQDGFPTVLTGLCKVKSRSMYDRLNKLRPDLAGITDALKVYIRSNHRYGYFTDLDYRPVILLEDDDEIEVGRTAAKDDIYRKLELEQLSGFLINIAMRLCWMEDLEPWVNKYPMQFLKLGVRMGHYDFVVRMLDVLEIVGIERVLRFSYEFMEDIGENGNLDLLRYILDRFILKANDDEVLITALQKAIKGAMITGQCFTLQCIQQRFGGNDIFPELFRINGDEEALKTEHWDCWEWNIDSCTNLGITTDTVLVIKNLEVAKKVVNKLGENSISFELLFAASRYVNVETFNYLWGHRHEEVLDEVMELYEFEDARTILENETGSEAALFKLIEEAMDIVPYDWEGGAFNLDVIRAYYNCNPTSNKLTSIMYTAARDRNFEVVEYLYSEGVKKSEEPLFSLAIEEKKFNVVQFLSKPGFREQRDDSIDITAAVLHGHLETVKFLHRKCCANATATESNDVKPCRNSRCIKKAQEAFLCAASKGDNDIVMYFIEKQREDFNLEMALYGAIQCGSFRLVRYFHGLGVAELIDDAVKADIQGWLERKPPTSKLVADLWTRFLNGRLSKQAIETNAIELWNQAFDCDWSGDLQLLPQDGLPTTLTGLCKVKSRSMYDRLNILRPDLAGITDALKVFIRSNHRYGYFTPLHFRPVILLEDDDDEIEVGRTKAKDRFYRKLELDQLSGFLIHIAMRLCWMEDLEPWVGKYPMQFLKLGVRMGHCDLVVRMWDVLDIDGIERSLRFSFDFLEDIGENGNLDLLKHMLDRFILKSNDDQGLVNALRRVIKGAMTTGKLSTLRYIQQRFSNQRIFPGLFSNARGQEFEHYSTEHLDCWEWSIDIYTNLDITANTVLVIKNLEVAKKVVGKLGEKSIRFDILVAASRYVNVEAFNYLWTHRHEEVLDEFMESFEFEEDRTFLEKETGSQAVLFKLIEGA